jgi:hypothetical protein
MTPYDITIIAATFCGLLMVAGSLFLLYKGAIKLEVASKDPALTVDMFKDKFKLTTHVPALALFVIGLAFVGLSIYAARDTAATPIEVKGEAAAPGEEVRVFFKSEWPVPVSGRQVFQVLRPRLDVITLVITAPGYQPFYQSYSKRDIGNLLDFGTVQLVRAVSRVETRAENIAPLPAGVNPPPLQWSGGFGGR